MYIFCLAIFFSCSNKKTEVAENTGENNETSITLTDVQLKNAGIVTASPEKHNMSPVLKVNGKIDVPPQNMVSVSVPLGGYLKSTHLLPGTKVKKGEILAVVEDQQYIQLQQDYLTSKINFIYIEKEYLRQKDLNLSKANSDKMLQQSESEYQSQKIKIKSLQEKLRLAGINPELLTENNLSRSVNILSPIDGFVTSVNVNIGKFVNPTDVLFELVNPNDIHLTLTVYEKDIDKLYIGQKVIAYTNNSAKQYTCEIILIAQNIAKDRSVEAHCHFINYDKSLIPGMFMNADIILRSGESPALPEEAVVSFENKKYIFEDKGHNTFQLVEVETGFSENGYIEIKNAPHNSKLVVKGAYTLLGALKNKGE
ncbi:MAG: efflux RND transporter periplasmic adaptor subunit [Bacteroidia bacterium]